MIVVADTSPFIGLLKIGRIDVLPALFGVVVIPPEVAHELADVNRPPVVRQFMRTAPTWLSVRTPVKTEFIADLDPGEVAAISLACELKADLLLIDESKGRQAALARHIRTARTAAVLFEAANAGIIKDLKAAFDALRSTNFRVPSEALDALLKQHEMLRDQQKDKGSE